MKQEILRDDAPTLERKVLEASMAVQLEREYSKDRILELYLNAIYFGNGAYGIEAAAHQYFGKTTQELTLAEGALLAGLIQRPSATDPYGHLEEATARLLEPMAAEARDSVKRNSNTNAVAHFGLTLAARFIPPKAWRKATAKWADWTPPKLPK